MYSSALALKNFRKKGKQSSKLEKLSSRGFTDLPNRAKFFFQSEIKNFSFSKSTTKKQHNNLQVGKVISPKQMKYINHNRLWRGFVLLPTQPQTYVYTENNIPNRLDQNWLREINFSYPHSGRQFVLATT